MYDIYVLNVLCVFLNVLCVFRSLYVMSPRHPPITTPIRLLQLALS